MTSLEKAKLVTQCKSVVVWSWDWEARLTENGQKVTLGGDENALKLDCSNSCLIVNLLKHINLYIYDEQTLWYTNYTSRELVFFRPSLKK